MEKWGIDALRFGVVCWVWCRGLCEIGGNEFTVPFLSATRYIAPDMPQQTIRP